MVLIRQQLDYKLSILKEDFNDWVNLNDKNKINLVNFACEVTKDLIDNTIIYTDREYKIIYKFLRSVADRMKHDMEN